MMARRKEIRMLDWMWGLKAFRDFLKYLEHEERAIKRSRRRLKYEILVDRELWDRISAPI